MPDQVELDGDIALAINGAYERGHPMVLSYIDAEGDPAVSFRGSVYV
jgi:hypothetical protein